MATTRVSAAAKDKAKMDDASASTPRPTLQEEAQAPEMLTEEHGLSVSNPVHKLLGKLPASFESFKDNIFLRVPFPLFEEALGLLHDKMLTRKSTKASPNSAYVSNTSSSKKKSNKKDRSTTKDSPQTTSKAECGFCGCSHPEHKCYAKRQASTAAKEDKAKKNPPSHNNDDKWHPPSNTKKDDNKAKVAYMVTSLPSPSHANVVISSPSSSELEDHLKEEWIADSGVSAHMTNSSSTMTNYKDSASHVRIGDDSSLAMHGFGDLSFGNASLHDVLHVPHLTSNLFSISKVTSKGLGVYFDDEVVEVIDHTSLSLVAHGTHRDGLYYVNSFTSTLSPHESHLHKLFSSSKALLTKEECALWHSRYGHVPYATLHQLFTKEMVVGLPKLKEPRHQVCSSCAAGKLHCTPLPLHVSWRASRALELIHADLTGPLEVPTLGGSLYYLLLIDDFSRMSWVFFLRKKSKALSKFEEWIALVKKQTELKVVTLRTDNGGEFVTFKPFLAASGISHHTIVPYTTEQSGVAERKNRIIKEMAYSMLHHASLHSSFWGEAVATAIYLLNKTSTKALDCVTPYEAFTGDKPIVHHLRVFGCVAYVHIPKAQRKTLNAKSKAMIFTGYAIGTKGYCPYSPLCDDIILARDVKFDEHNFDATTILPNHLSSTLLDDPFHPIEPTNLVNPSSSSMAPPTSSTSSTHPKWICSLLKDAGTLDIPSSSSRRLHSHDMVNKALMAHLQDVYESETVMSLYPSFSLSMRSLASIFSILSSLKDSLKPLSLSVGLPKTTPMTSRELSLSLLLSLLSSLSNGYVRCK
ncbi:hypothetical protein L7F22_049889 [Adiantum nelumboides]|nr:hypothetical protein [Adiantum nelumboides]